VSVLIGLRMNFRRTFLAAIALGTVGCAALPSNSFGGCLDKTADGTDCGIIQGDAGADAMPLPWDAAVPDAVGAGLVARSHLCGPECSPDDPLACVGDAGGDAASDACRVVLGAGQQTSTTCASAGDGTDGASCTSGADCAPGFECVGTGTCRHYCCDDSQCTTMTVNNGGYNTYFCDVANERAASGAVVPVCLVVQSCYPLKAEQCSAGQACTIVEIDDGKSLVATCDDVGDAKLGDSCETTHCAAGFACIGNIGERTCQQLCDSQNPCPANSATPNCNTKSPALAPFNGVGICGP
jgi:hypothetical protein